MKPKLESLMKKGKTIGLAGLMSLAMGCASSKFYIEPKVGVMVPEAAKEQAYDPSATIGGDCGLSGKVIGLEAGLDYFHSSEEYIKTNSFLPRVNASFSPLKETAKVKPYAMVGVNLLSESSTIDIPEFDVHDKVSNTTWGIGTGVGVTIFDRIDGRVTYTGLPESENVKGMVNLTLGYRFLFGGK